MKIAVVTGASSGIGREFVYSIDKRANYDEIWVIARRADRLEELKTKCKNKIRPLSLDLSLKEDIEKYAKLLRDENADISILVNAAGCGEDVIIMLKGKNAVTKRVSELPQSTKFKNCCQTALTRHYSCRVKPNKCRVMLSKSFEMLSKCSVMFSILSMEIFYCEIVQNKFSY